MATQSTASIESVHGRNAACDCGSPLGFTSSLRDHSRPPTKCPRAKKKWRSFSHALRTSPGSPAPPDHARSVGRLLVGSWRSVSVRFWPLANGSGTH